MRYDGLRHGDIDSLNMNMTEMIQQSVTSVAKQTKKHIKPRIASPTRTIMKKRREMIEHNTPRDHIDVDIDPLCMTIIVIPPQLYCIQYVRRSVIFTSMEHSTEHKLNIRWLMVP